MFPAAFKSLNDQEKHDYILKTYVLNKSQNVGSRKHKRDIDVIREHHKFLWESIDCADSWEQQLARRYYDKLFKEYCIADLTRYKENKVALRWRIEPEVVSGKGQFQCGSRKCDERDNLKSWEVNFAYQEDGERKNALVKLRLCPEHSNQLNYSSRKREVKRLKKAEKNQKKFEKRGNKYKSKKEEDKKDVNSKNIENDITTDVPSQENPNVENETTTTTGHDHEIHIELENIWSKKLDTESENMTRESEFESYLEDLLL